MTFESKLIPILRQGVDMVRMIAFKRFRDSVGGSDGGVNGRVAGALVNAIFDPSSAEADGVALALAERELFRQSLARAAETLGDLRIPVTDALRIQALCDHQEGEDSTATLRRAQELGVLLTERELPLPHSFLNLVRTLGQAWGLLSPPASRA
ncbi:MAG: hypothetical protein ACOY3Z_11040 [Thermodesulfobacteriota bacterium]